MAEPARLPAVPDLPEETPVAITCNGSAQAVMMESGALGPPHWLIAQIAAPPIADEPREDTLFLGLEARFAENFALARGVSLKPEDAVPIGPGCRTCRRVECPARSLRGPSAVPTD